MLINKRSICLLLALTLFLLTRPTLQRIQKERAERAVVNSTLTCLFDKYDTIFKTEKTRTSDHIIAQSVGYAFRYSRLLGLESIVDTELALFHVESRFDPKSSGDGGKSYGIGQTAHAAEHKWRNYWRIRGVELGSFDAVETQIAFSVAELAYCIGKSRGDVKEGVRRYNGAGPRARKYVVLVMRARRLLFGHQYERGEHVTNWGDLTRGV